MPDLNARPGRVSEHGILGVTKSVIEEKRAGVENYHSLWGG